MGLKSPREVCGPFLKDFLNMVTGLVGEIGDGANNKRSYGK